MGKAKYKKCNANNNKKRYKMQNAKCEMAGFAIYCKQKKRPLRDCSNYIRNKNILQHLYF